MSTTIATTILGNHSPRPLPTLSNASRIPSTNGPTLPTSETFRSKLPPRYTRGRRLTRKCFTTQSYRYRAFLGTLGPAPTHGSIPRPLRVGAVRSVALSFDVQQCTPSRCEAHAAAFVAESKSPTGERPTCVWRRDQGRGVQCGSRERLEFDHIIPVLRRRLRHGAQHPVVVRALQQGEGRQNLVLNRSQPSKLARVRPEQVQASIDPTRGGGDCREWRRSLARTPHTQLGATGSPFA